MSTIQWKTLVAEDKPTRRPPDSFVRMVWAITPKHWSSPLTVEEELRLIARVKDDDDKAALADLLAAHERMLVNTARKVARQNDMPTHIKDMVQTAYLAFIEAVQRYEIGNPARISTFARYRVSGALLKHALDFRHAMSFGRGSEERKAYYHARAAIDHFTENNGRPPSGSGSDLGDIAGRLGISPKAMKRGVEARDIKTLPIDRVEAWDTDRSIFEDVDHKRVASIVAAARQKTLDGLSERDAKIAAAFFDDPDGFTSRTYAEMFSITQERVGQLRRQAMATMRAHVESMGLTAGVLAS